MTNPNLFYEVSEISTPEEVKAAYLYAQENNVKYYRAISKANHGIYGWDVRKGQYIMLDTAVKNAPTTVEKVEDAYWFLNDHYVAPKAETATVSAESVEGKTAPVATAPEEVKEEPVAEQPAPVEEEETPYVPDYKTMFERLKKKYLALKKQFEDKENYETLFRDAREALSQKSQEFTVLKANYIKARDAQAKTLARIEEIEESIEEIEAICKEVGSDLNGVKVLNLE